MLATGNKWAYKKAPPPPNFAQTFGFNCFYSKFVPILNHTLKSLVKVYLGTGGR